jgi:hypothetical protein
MGKSSNLSLSRQQNAADARCTENQATGKTPARKKIKTMNNYTPTLKTLAFLLPALFMILLLLAAVDASREEHSSAPITTGSRCRSIAWIYSSNIIGTALAQSI